MANTKKTWISIVVAGVIIVVVLCLAVVGSTAFFIYRHINTQFVPTETAASQFETTRARFANQQPLIDLASDEVLDADNESHGRVTARVRHDLEGNGQPISALHVLAYDRRAGKLVRADIPRWLLQLGSAGGHIRLANLDVLQLEDHSDKLTLEDLDRRGPGLILDVRRLRGAQLLVWTD